MVALGKHFSLGNGLTIIRSVSVAREGLENNGEPEVSSGSSIAC